MGDEREVEYYKYRECLRKHEELKGKSDGCQEFIESSWSPSDCSVCNCHKNFHRKVGPPIKFPMSVVVYMKCLKIHEYRFKSTFDGCQEFVVVVDGGGATSLCAVCGCHKSFHRIETKYD